MPQEWNPFEFDCEEDDILDFILGASTCTDWIRGTKNLARRFRYRESGREKPRIVECDIDPGNTAELIDREINCVGRYARFLGFLKVDPEGLRRVREGEKAEDVLTGEELDTVRRLVSFAVLWKDARKREVLVWSPEIEASTLREIAQLEQKIAETEETIAELEPEVAAAKQRVARLRSQVPEPPGYEETLREMLLLHFEGAGHVAGLHSLYLRKRYKLLFGEQAPGWVCSAVPRLIVRLISKAFEVCRPLPEHMDLPLWNVWDWEVASKRYWEKFKQVVPPWVKHKTKKEALKRVREALETGVPIPDAETC